MALKFTSPENLEALKQELIDLTFQGILTTDADDLVTGTLAPDRIGNDSVIEAKLHPDVRAKLNAEIGDSQLVSTVSPIKFDSDYQIGSPSNPISTNITFDLIGANPGSATSVFHQASSAPILGTNIKKALINFTLSDYENNELNEFVFHYMEDPNNANEPYLKIYHTKNITIINAI